MKTDKPYAIVDGYKCTVEQASILLEKSSQKNGFYIGERECDLPEKRVLESEFSQLVVGTSKTIIELIKNVISKIANKKSSVINLPKMTKGYATALGDEGFLFVQSNDKNQDNNEWELSAIGVRKHFYEIVSQHHRCIMLSPQIIYPIVTLKKPLLLGCSGKIAVLTTTDYETILICGTVDVDKRLELFV